MKSARILVLSLVAIAGTSFANDWPEFRGADRTGVWKVDGLVENFEGLPDPFPRVWSTPVGAGYSGPMVAEDSVFVIDRGEPGGTEQVERVVFLDRATGAQRSQIFARNDRELICVDLATP